MRLLSDIYNEVLLRLGESGNSPAPVVPTGTDTSNTLSATAGFVALYNQVASDICRTCYPHHSTATVTDVPTGTQALQLASAPTSENGTLWLVRGVTYGGTAMTYCSRARLEVYYPTWQTDQQDTPVYWYQEGEEVGLYPRPTSVSGDVVLSGYGVPEMIDVDTSSLTEQVSWLPDDVMPLLITGIAAALCSPKNADDPSLLMRHPELQGEYDAMTAARWRSLPADLRTTVYAGAGLKLGLTK